MLLPVSNNNSANLGSRISKLNRVGEYSVSESMQLIDMQLTKTPSELFKWWCHLHFWRNNSQRQFEQI